MKKEPENLVFLIIIIDVTIATRPVTIIAYFNVEWTAVQLKPWEMEAIGNENKDWKVLDKFGNMFESTDWEKATEGLLIHERCSLNFH